MRARKRRIRRYRPAAPISIIRRLPRPRIEIDRGLAWYALWTAPRAEGRVADALREKSLAAYVPIEAVSIPRRGRDVEIERPVVSRYVFVGLDAANPQWSAVHASLDGPMGWLAGLSALGRVLKVAGQSLRVPPAAIQGLVDALFVPEVGMMLFTPGRGCRVLAGPFAGFWGIVETADDCRVRALLDVFGRRTVVEFEPGQLEAA